MTDMTLILLDLLMWVIVFGVVCFIAGFVIGYDRGGR